jgi:hypothetical protein
MSQETVKKQECIQTMSDLQTDTQKSISNLGLSLRRLFWGAMAVIIICSCGGFKFYYDQQEKKINKIAVASIKADERLEVRITKAEQRQIEVEKQQAAMGARIDANMKWLMDACSRIETKQTRIEERLEK